MDEVKAALIATLVLALAVAPGYAEPGAEFSKMIKTYSEQEIIALDIDEEYSFTLKNGATKLMRLLSVKEYRDSVIGMTRRAEVDVLINGAPLRLICAPYGMPTEIDGLRIQADTTSEWLRIDKRVQFSLWDASDPIVNADRFFFPMPDHLLFSHALQSYNEVGHLGHNDGNPGGIIFYMEHGVDIAGYEGREVIVSPIDGTVLLVYPNRENICSVAVQDGTGMIFDLAHLDSIFPDVGEGIRVTKGQKIGMLGNTCSSGNFSHLWITSFLVKDDIVNAKVEEEEPFDRQYWLNLYPWLVTAYMEQQDTRHLYAVARPHHTILAGEEALFDGSYSLASGKSIVSYRWQFHDGETVDSVIARKRFDKPGTYIASLWVRNEEGLEDVDFCRIKVFPRSGSHQKESPTIFMTYTPTKDIAVNQPVLFRFWIQGGDRTRPMKVDFGDGTVIPNYLSYCELHHRFATPGIHIVTAKTTLYGMPVMQKQKVIVSGTRKQPAESME